MTFPPVFPSQETFWLAPAPKMMMNDAPDKDIREFKEKLQEITIVIQSLSQQRSDNCQELLLLLRTLEHLHREIREQHFEPSLPNTRKELYTFLREIEETGGWPYIERMRLKDLLAHLFAEPSNSLLSTQRTTND